MSKSKTFREKDNERVHGKISYRKRVIEEVEAEDMIKEFEQKNTNTQDEEQLV